MGTERHVKCVPDLVFIAATELQCFCVVFFILFCGYEVLRWITSCVLATESTSIYVLVKFLSSDRKKLKTTVF